jgi:Ankyrin repeats (many copies)
MDSICYALKNNNIEMLTILASFSKHPINYNLLQPKLHGTYLLYAVKTCSSDIIKFLLQ